MNEVTKKYRLIWDSNKIITGDPFEEQLNSTTLVNTSNYFESDDVADIQPKIDELGLEYQVEEEIEEEPLPVLPPDPE